MAVVCGVGCILGFSVGFLALQWELRPQIDRVKMLTINISAEVILIIVQLRQNVNTVLTRNPL